MSKWDGTNFDNEKYNQNSDNEEIRLLKKFEDYKQLEKIEYEKRNPPQIMYNGKLSFLKNYLHVVAWIQCMVIVGCTTVFMFVEFINPEIKLLVLSITTIAISVEIVFMSTYLKKLDKEKNASMNFESITEFNGI